MKLNWNFLGGGERGEGCKTKNLPWGSIWVFSVTAHCSGM